MEGRVSLVGAGPGDPELLTLKAVRRLEGSDLVLHDALVSPEILALAPQARTFDVGKRAGRKSIAQETIHRIMIHAACRGQHVVRLKGGDPFVFGRGGEEALALAAAGIPVEVIPGVTSAVAAPALSGIPVTHRGLASAFIVVSGHHPEAYRELLTAVPPHSLTLVVLMGLATRAELGAFLIERGWRPETPAAVVFDASTPRAATWIGTLRDWAVGRVPSPERAPGVLVIGAVVSLAERIAFGDPSIVPWEKGVSV